MRHLTPVIFVLHPHCPALMSCFRCFVFVFFSFRLPLSFHKCVSVEFSRLQAFARADFAHKIVWYVRVTPTTYVVILFLSLSLAAF